MAKAGSGGGSKGSGSGGGKGTGSPVKGLPGTRGGEKPQMPTKGKGR